MRSNSVRAVFQSSDSKTSMAAVCQNVKLERLERNERLKLQATRHHGTSMYNIRTHGIMFRGTDYI
jgi:hypothetical protein